MNTKKCRFPILHLSWHRRKVCGTVSEAGGRQIADARVTLEKKNTNTLDREEENIFTILQSRCCSVETKWESKKYITDAAISCSCSSESRAGMKQTNCRKKAVLRFRVGGKTSFALTFRK